MTLTQDSIVCSIPEYAHHPSCIGRSPNFLYITVEKYPRYIEHRGDELAQAEQNGVANTGMSCRQVDLVYAFTSMTST